MRLAKILQFFHEEAFRGNAHFGTAMTPAFGLDANIAPAPLSALLSLVMIAGVDALGFLVLRYLPLKAGSPEPWLRYQAPLVGAALLAAVTFPLALAGIFPRTLAIICALLLVGWGSFHGLHVLRQVRIRWRLAGKTNSLDTPSLALGAFVIGYGLLALGPVTESDSLDYHVGVALEILNTGAFPVRPEWFHSRLAGSGEVLIAIGLSIGAEQFGALLQLLGVLAIVSLFLAIPGVSGTEGKWIALAVVSCPAFIAWVASPKPMLLPGAMTTAALLLIYFHLRELHDKRPAGEVRNAFILVCLLTMIAATMKLNFMLSGSVVGGLAVLLLLRPRFWVIVILVGIPMFFILLLPFAFWKSQNFGGGALAALVHAFPGNWPGTAEFESMLRAYRDTTVAFPISLLVPSGIGTLTTILGVGLLLLISSMQRRMPNGREIIAAALIVSIGGVIFGQRNARFFLEPFYWLLIAYHLGCASAPSFSILTGRTIKFVISMQAGAVYVMLTFGVVAVLPGALLPSWREKVMNRSANGYAAMRWAHAVLPVGVTMISTIRSVALAPRFVIANDWQSYVSEGSPGAKVYASIVAEKSPEYVLISTGQGAPAPQAPCAKNVYAGPFSAEVATRNPFNSGSRYDTWLLKLDPACLRKDPGE